MGVVKTHEEITCSDGICYHLYDAPKYIDNIVSCAHEVLGVASSMYFNYMCMGGAQGLWQDRIFISYWDGKGKSGMMELILPFNLAKIAFWPAYRMRPVKHDVGVDVALPPRKWWQVWRRK